MLAAVQTAVTCPWCRLYIASRPDDGHCANCGGPLPAPSGTALAPPPPPAPRMLPAPYRRQVLFSRNALSIVGFIFACVGSPFLLVSVILLLTRSAHVQILVLVYGLLGVVFLGVGVPLFMAGRRRGLRRLAALSQGAPAEGQILSVEQNLSVRINGQSPWSIDYSFAVAGTPMRGSAQSLAPAAGEYRKGDSVWIVYLPGDPGINTMWPPLA